MGDSLTAEEKAELIEDAFRAEEEMRKKRIREEGWEGDTCDLCGEKISVDGKLHLSCF